MVPLRFELGILDLESNDLTTRPWNSFKAYFILEVKSGRISYNLATSGTVKLKTITFNDKENLGSGILSVVYDGGPWPRRDDRERDIGCLKTKWSLVRVYLCCIRGVCITVIHDHICGSIEG